MNHDTLEVLGDGSVVNAVKVKNKSSDNVYDIKVDGVFVAIGHKPNTDIFKEYLELDQTGYIVNKAGSTHTNVPGVFVAGMLQIMSTDKL